MSHHYTESGLDNIYLESGFHIHDPSRARAVRSARSTGDKKPAQIMPHDESQNRPMASGFSDYR